MASSIITSLSSALRSRRNPYSSSKCSPFHNKQYKNTSQEAFFEHLNERLVALCEPDHKEQVRFFSVEWLVRAMSVALWACSSAAGALLDLPRLSEKGQEVLEANLDDTANLLDVCNALTEVLCDIHHYLMLLRYVGLCVEGCKSLSRKNTHASPIDSVRIEKAMLHEKDTVQGRKVARQSSQASQINCVAVEKDMPDEPTLLKVRDTMLKCVDFMKAREEDVIRKGCDRSKLKTCSSWLRDVSQHVSATTVKDASKHKGIFSEIHAAKSVTIFICSVLAAALAVKSKQTVDVVPPAQGHSWSSTLMKLQQDVNEAAEILKTHGSVIFLQELDMLHGDVEFLSSLVSKGLELKIWPDDMNLRLLFQLLLKNSTTLQERLSTLQQQVDELFRMIVAIRGNFLNNLCHSQG